MSATWSERKDFIYMLQEKSERIPRDVTHVKVHPSVRVIGARAFAGCSRLMHVELCKGLKTIEEYAFFSCTSLRDIVIPPSVKAIDQGAFRSCSQLRNVKLRKGLEKIGNEAFYDCRMLQRIMIPSTITAIEEGAFGNCSRLTNVEFCDEIEQFVSGESIQDWWNHGVCEKSLSTYCYFAQRNVPKRLGLVQKKWQINIHGMLRRIPAISPNDLNDYFDSIDSKLSFYENLNDAPALLELAIWKSKITLNTNLKMECRSDSVAMVIIIVPNVLSFLTDDNDGDYGDNGINDNDGSNNDSEGDDDTGDDNYDVVGNWPHVFIEM